MVNRMDKDKMDQVRKCLWMVMSTFRGMNKNATLFVATLLYFRKLNGLSVTSGRVITQEENGKSHTEPSECLCYDKCIVEKEKNENFRNLLGEVISEYEEYFNGNFASVADFAHSLVEHEFTEEELLSILDSAIANSFRWGHESYLPCDGVSWTLFG